VGKAFESVFSGKRILITGGLGFLGSTLAGRLAGFGADVQLVDSLVPEYGGNRFNIRGFEDAVHVNISDVRDEHSFRYLVGGQDYLFNLAGQTSHLDSMLDPFTDLEINCRAQLSILEACRKYNPSIRIVFASTRQIYGKPDYLPVDEQHLCRPMDVNGVNKMAGESFHILYHNVYGIAACALRLGNTYGPRMRIKDARQTFLGTWIRLAIERRPFEVWGGHQLRDFAFVDEKSAVGADAHRDRLLLIDERLGRRLRQIDRNAGGHQGRRDHEDDEQHQHYVDKWRHIDVGHRRRVEFAVMFTQREGHCGLPSWKAGGTARFRTRR